MGHYSDAYAGTNILDDIYDGNGNVAAITDGATGQAQRGNRTMTYDGLDRLTDVASPMYGTTGAHYTYDVLDNLTGTTAPGRSGAWAQSYCIDPTTNQMTNVKVNGDCSTGTTILGLGYDVQGNMNNWNGKLHNFDYGNRLRSVTDVESYRYDAYGRRLRAWTATGGLLYSLYSQSGQLLWQRDARSAQRREYVYLNGSLVAERSRPLTGSTATLTYQHTDALGTPVVKTSAGRVVLQRREYEPYGKLLNTPLESGPGYAGHDTDPATLYTYMQQRYYDPRVGRFLSVDPVTPYGTGDMRLFNRYAYAANSPYTFKDPDGRIFDTIADVGFIAYSAYVLAKDPSWTNAAALGADVVGAAVPFATGLGAGVRAAAHADDLAKIAGKAQVTRAAGKETTHAATSTRIAGEQVTRADAQSVHLNQTISTVTNKEVKSSLRPDVATVRTDGKVDVTEVLSPRQEAGATAEKYNNALGDKAGTIKCVPMDGC